MPDKDWNTPGIAPARIELPEQLRHHALYLALGEIKGNPEFCDKCQALVKIFRKVGEPEDLNEAYIDAYGQARWIDE
jgi:hypothetical protein